MAIKQHYQTAIQGLISEKDRAVAAEKDRVMKEQIVPHNGDVEKYKTEAINSLTNKLNEDIANLQKCYNSEKAAIIEASEKKKAAFAEQAISTATSIVALEYDREITSLEKHMSELKD
jgi:hypothetical protein